MSTLIAGIPFDKIFKKIKTKTQVTRFNEMTGIPYTKEIPVVRFFIGNKEVNSDNTDELCDEVKKVSGLSLFFYNFRNLNTCMIGLKVVKAAEYRTCSTFNEDYLKTVISKVEKLFNEIGYSGVVLIYI